MANVSSVPNDFDFDFDFLYIAREGAPCSMSWGAQSSKPL
jgi:hypothetical protein